MTSGPCYYFAARFSRHPEMRDYRDALQAAIVGAKVTSRWIDCHGGEQNESYTPHVLATQPGYCWRNGQAVHCHPQTEVYQHWAAFLEAEVTRSKAQQ